MKKSNTGSNDNNARRTREDMLRDINLKKSLKHKFSFFNNESSIRNNFDNPKAITDNISSINFRKN